MKEHTNLPQSKRGLLALSFLRGFMSYADVFGGQSVSWPLYRSFSLDKENLRADFLRGYILFSKQKGIRKIDLRHFDAARGRPLEKVEDDHD